MVKVDVGENFHKLLHPKLATLIVSATALSPSSTY